jgi:hypothetical protein
MKDKALAIIKALASDDEVVDLKFKVMIEEETDKQLIRLVEILSEIYKYADIAQNPNCAEIYPKGVIELENVYQSIRKEERT